MTSPPLYPPFLETSITESFSTRSALITGLLCGFLCVVAFVLRLVLKRSSRRIIEAESMDSTPEDGYIASPSTSSLLRTLMGSSTSPARCSPSTLSPLAWSPAPANSRGSNLGDLRTGSAGCAPAESPRMPSYRTSTATHVSRGSVAFCRNREHVRTLDDESGCVCRVRLHARPRGDPSLAHQGQTVSRRSCPHLR